MFIIHILIVSNAYINPSIMATSLGLPTKLCLLCSSLITGTLISVLAVPQLVHPNDGWYPLPTIMGDFLLFVVYLRQPHSCDAYAAIDVLHLCYDFAFLPYFSGHMFPPLSVTLWQIPQLPISCLTILINTCLMRSHCLLLIGSFVELLVERLVARLGGCVSL